MSGGGREDGGEAGFVLVSVLGIVALFVAASAGFAVRAHLHLVQTSRLAEAARLEALADGAALFALDALREPAPPSGTPPPADGREALPVDGRPLVCGTEGSALPAGFLVELRIADAGGLLDLNAAPPGMIEAFFRAAGLDARAAGALAGEIAVRRLPPADGEPERRGPFLDVGEVAALRLGPSARRLEPLLTVDNPAPGLDLAATDARARALLPRGAERLPELRPWLLPSRAEAFRIEAAVVGPDGWARAGRRADIRFGENRTGEPAVNRWSRPPLEALPRPPERLQASPHPFCRLLAAALGAPPEGVTSGRAAPR